MKFLIYLEGNPQIQGYTRFEFKWSQKHGVYLFNGQETEKKDFNEVAARVFSIPQYRLMFPKVKLLGSEEEPTREITVAEAEEVMERLAPHRLKKKPGPKSEPVAA